MTGWLVFALLTGPGALCDEPVASAEEYTSAFYIRSAPIDGRIFLLTEEKGEEEIAGANVYVKIKRPHEREILYQTKTLKDGSYALPALESQDYKMLVGDLQLDLKVLPDTEERADMSKALIIMIPFEMAGPGAGKPQK